MIAINLIINYWEKILVGFIGLWLNDCSENSLWILWQYILSNYYLKILIINPSVCKKKYYKFSIIEILNIF